MEQQYLFAMIEATEMILRNKLAGFIQILCKKNSRENFVKSDFKRNTYYSFTNSKNTIKCVSVVSGIKINFITLF